jgi:L-ribulose-5-phosphate 4-epimerase
MSHELEQVKVQFIEAARRAYRRGIQTGNGGNISARVPSEPLMVVKPSGVSLIDCTPETVIITDFDGNLVEGKRKPTRESVLHGELYKNLPKVAGVVHTHSPWSIAWSYTGRELPLLTLHTQLKLACPVPVKFFASPKGVLKEEMSIVLELFAEHPDLTAFIMGAHGVVTVGPSVLEAEHTAELIEETAQVAYLHEIGARMNFFSNTSAVVSSRDVIWLTRESLAECCRAVVAKQFVVGTEGSISARCGDCMYILGSGAPMSDANPKDFVGLELSSGRSLDATRLPSTEALLHLACYRKRPDIQAVIHTYPPMSIAVASCGMRPEAYSPDSALLLGEVGKVDYTQAGVAELAGEVESVIGRHNAILLGNQGVLSVGADLAQALLRTEFLEKGARITIASRGLGGKPL